MITISRCQGHLDICGTLTALKRPNQLVSTAALPGLQLVPNITAVPRSCLVTHQHSTQSPLLRPQAIRYRANWETSLACSNIQLQSVCVTKLHRCSGMPHLLQASDKLPGTLNHSMSLRVLKKSKRRNIHYQGARCGEASLQIAARCCAHVLTCRHHVLSQSWGFSSPGHFEVILKMSFLLSGRHVLNGIHHAVAWQCHLLTLLPVVAPLRVQGTDICYSTNSVAHVGHTIGAMLASELLLHRPMRVQAGM